MVPSSGKSSFQDRMKTSDLDYALPEELIAQVPVEPRDESASWYCTEKQECWSTAPFATSAPI